MAAFSEEEVEDLLAELTTPAEDPPLQLMELGTVETMESAGFELDEDLRIMLEGLVVQNPTDLGGAPAVSVATSPTAD